MDQETEEKKQPDTLDSPGTDRQADTSADVSPSQTESTPQEPTAPAVSPLAITDPALVSKKRKLPWLALAAVVVLGGAIAAALTVARPDKQSPVANNQSKTVSDIPVVRVGSTDGPIGMDYIFPNPAPANLANQIDFQVFEGLVGYKDQRIVPLLASSWTNPDTKTWVFTLKPNVRFHNGKTVSAQDVKQSLDTLVKDEDWGYYLQTIESVELSGTDKVVVKTVSPDAVLLNRLAYGFVFSKNDDGSVSGTGAYTVDAANSASESKTKLVAYEGYHQGTPKTKSIEYTVFESKDEITKALAEGKLDIGESLRSEEAKKDLSAKGFEAYDYFNSGSYGLVMNIKRANGPLAKKEVREALAYAIDRESYEKQAGGGKVATRYAVPKTVVGYDASAEFPDVNVGKSRELQTAAGYPGGAPISFVYIEGLQKEVPVLIEQLKAAGFKVTPRPVASPREAVALASSGTVDIISGSYTTDLGDATDIFAGLLDSQASRFPFYANPAFDAMLRSAESTFQPAEHLKKVQEINRYVRDNYLFIPVTSDANTVYYPKNYTFTVDSLVGLSSGYLWKVGKQ